GGTVLAERVRDIVLARGTEAITPVAETLLMFAARSIHVENLVRPALGRGDWVLCDRFTDATRAYQGGGRGVDRTWIEGLAMAVHANCEPDRTLLLDLPAAMGLARVAARRAQADRFDAEHEEFFERVRAAYLELARDATGHFRIIDAGRDVDAVTAASFAAIEDLL
ncbi:MAG: dTMP kinase, partial [Steroidobacteraceae bacterium]